MVGVRAVCVAFLDNSGTSNPNVVCKWKGT